MSALLGSRLGPYEILAPLGAGGMGAVYRARDTRLGREVAVKVLPPHMLESSDGLVRFEREARAVAALSHPNILALHDIGRDGTVAYAVTELLEGETLRAAIARGPMPARRALDVLAQVARGLGAAHERGIVHRDIKPENLFLTRDGRVKILDFGIATQPDTAETVETTSPVVTTPGMMIGTPTYMAPEQIVTQPATARTDLFAFGIVAHEVLTGAHPFKRSTDSDTIAAILREEPAPLGRAGAALPPGTGRLLARCLEKAPSDRPGSARDLSLFLEALSTAPDAVTEAALEAQPGVARLVRWRVFYASVVTALMIVALTWGYTGLMTQRVVSGAATIDLARAQRLVQRVQDEQLSQLALTSDLIASFPALKSLLGTDVATVRDFLGTHQALVPGKPMLAALLPDGRVVARTDNATAAPPAPGDTWIDPLVTKNAGPRVVTIDGRLFHAASAASDAGGNTFGYVVAALPVDQAFARALSDATQEEVVLLADGLVASTLRGAEAPWKSLQEWRDAGGRVERTIEMTIGAQRFDAQEVVLSAQPALSAIVARSRDDAAAPFRRIQSGLLVIGLIGIALAIAGAFWIARGATRVLTRDQETRRSKRN